jgi:hypothetical protein
MQSAERDALELVSGLVAVMSRPPPPAPAKRRSASWLARFYRSSYFWPVVGGVLGAAAIGTGVGLGVYYGTRGGTGDRDRRFITFY